MSLIHHWPLVDGLKDNLSRVPLTGNSTEVTGKIGPCRELDGQFLQASDSKLKGLDIFSISMWIKYSETKADWADIFGLGIQHNVSLQVKSLRLEVTSTNGTSAGVFNNGILTNSGGAGRYLTLTKEKWHHFVLTKDNELIQYFLDGMLIHQYRFLDVAGCSDGWCTGEFHLGDVNYKGCFSDVRIYDHILSQAEVSELAKALAVHYTFDDRLAEATTNLLYNQSVSFAELTVYLTQSLQHKVYTLTSSTLKPNFSTGTIRFKVPLSILENGQVYYFSYKYKMLSGDGSRFEISDWCDAAVTEKTDIDCGDYRYVSARCYLDPTKKEYNDTYRFMDFLMNPNTSVQVWDIQLQSSLTPTQYTPSTRSSKLCNELGGIQPDKTQTKNITTIKDSAIGTYSLKCDQTAIVTPLVADITQGVTISCWVKTPTYPTSNEVVFADTNSKLAFGFYNNTEAIISCADYSTAKITNFQKAWMGENNTLEKEWHHIVVTRDKEGATRCWLNGLELTEKGTSNNWTQDKDALIIGTRYNSGYGPYFSGYVDDFRVYQTALSEDDILDLYNTKAYLIHDGDWACNQFIENCTEACVTKKGSFELNEIYEQLLPREYEQLEYIQCDTQSYINTGYNSNKPYQIDCDMEVSEAKYNYWFGQRQQYVNNTNMLYNAFYYSSVLEYDWKNVPITNRLRHTMTQTLSADKSKITISIDGKSQEISAGKNGQSGDLYIFACRYANDGFRHYGAPIKLYSFKVHEGSLVVRDFIPAMRKADGVIGLYDVATQSFYTNAGSGLFTAGQIVTEQSAMICDNKNVIGREIIEI